MTTADSESTGKPLNPYDAILWPDGVWCYANELDGYQYKSDDFERIEYCSGKWCEITDQVPY
jgi:hypothetical protein